MTNKQQSIQQPDSPLAIISMVLGVLSLTGPGFILGIPAIILAIIALKKKAGGKGLSIAGLVTGIVSTVISLILVGLLIWLMTWAANHPEEFEDYRQDVPSQNDQLFDSSET